MCPQLIKFEVVLDAVLGALYPDQNQREKVALLEAPWMIFDACCVAVVAPCVKKGALLTALDGSSGVMVSNTERFHFRQCVNLKFYRFE